MTESEEQFERQMAVARDCMDKYKVALSVLAQGENSPHMTEEFKASLIEASRRLERYRAVKPE